MKKLMIGLMMASIMMPLGAKAYAWPGNHWTYANPVRVNVTIGSTIPGAWAYYIGYEMGQWNNAGAKFFFQTAVGGKNQINLKYVGNPTALAVTHIYEGLGARVTTERDVDISNRFSWDVNGASYKFDAASVVAHELGHWLTLGDLYSGDSYWYTMFYSSAAGQTYKRSLAGDDISGIRRIYGMR
jgi:hypothetical protein